MKIADEWFHLDLKIEKGDVVLAFFKEIKNWVEEKEKEFTEQENRNRRLSTKDWL